ncbi:MAG: TetR/AcrR family transcriptional regulator [Dehalococcoidia bacterium]
MRKKNFVIRRKRSAALRIKLFETAVELVEKVGYDNVSIDEICKRVGVTKGAFYRHFKSKDQIVTERHMAYDAGFTNELLPQVSHMQPGIEKLMAYIRLTMKYMYSTTKKLVRLGYIVALSKKEPPYTPNKRELYKVLEQLVREGQACGEIRKDLPCAQISSTLLYSIIGLVFCWCMPGNRVDLEKACDHFLDIIQPGLRTTTD